MVVHSVPKNLEPKAKAITGGQNGKKTKKVTKEVKKSKRHEQCRRGENSQGKAIFLQVAKISQPCSFSFFCFLLFISSGF